MTDFNDIADRTVAILEQLNKAGVLNITVMCKEIGIGRNKFYEIMNGKSTNIPATMVAYLEQVYNVNSKYILFGKTPVFYRGTMAKKWQKLHQNCKSILSLM